MSSQLSRVEVVRTVNLHASELLQNAYDVLADISMVHINTAVITLAESLPTFIKLRALDSIHIATVLSIQGQIDGVITYDKDMATAAVALGITVVSPGIK